jgi:hypothetical protein
MGYFAVGFAFPRAPNWQALRALLPQHRLRGYQHKSAPLCMLDVWEPDTGSKREHYPFVGDFENPAEIAGAAPASALGSAFDKVADALDIQYIYRAGWGRLAAAVARAAGTETLLFRANDDEYHFACLARPDGGEPVAELLCRYEDIRLRAEGGKLIAQLYEPIEDEEEYATDEDEFAQSLEGIAGVAIGPRLEPVDGFLIHHEAVELWPAAWGNCETLLGLGTFDPFVQMGEDFKVVLEA